MHANAPINISLRAREGTVSRCGASPAGPRDRSRFASEPTEPKRFRSGLCSAVRRGRAALIDWPTTRRGCTDRTTTTGLTMPDLNQPTREAVVLERTLPVPPERVWPLWTEPTHFAAWSGPLGATVTVRAMDVRVGGERRVSMTVPTPDGERVIHFAAFTSRSSNLGVCSTPRRWLTPKTRIIPPGHRPRCRSCWSAAARVPGSPSPIAASQPAHPARRAGQWLSTSSSTPYRLRRGADQRRGVATGWRSLISTVIGGKRQLDTVLPAPAPGTPARCTSRL